jgi:hypothetical protein
MCDAMGGECEEKRGASIGPGEPLALPYTAPAATRRGRLLIACAKTGLQE